MPFRSPMWSPILPMITGTTAPPIPIPVPRIPAKEPWYSDTEFRASEITIGHMIEANKPNRRECSHGDVCGTKQCQRQAQKRSDGNTDQNLAAVEDFQQQHSDQAARCHQSPEPGNRGGASGVRVEAVILRKKL